MTHKEMIDQLQSEAKELQQKAKGQLEAADMLLQTAALLEIMDREAIAVPSNCHTPTTKRVKRSNKPVDKPIGGRLKQLTDFIRANAPVSRKKIFAESGIPEGTLNTKLNLANFHQDSDGFWNLKPVSGGD